MTFVTFITSVVKDEAFAGLVALIISFLSFLVAMASLVATVWGWRVARKDSEKLQTEHYRNQLLFESAKLVSGDLLNYIRWCVEHSTLLERVQYTNGVASAESLKALSDHAALPTAGDWILSTRASAEAMPSLANTALQLAAAGASARIRVQRGVATSREEAIACAADFMALAERADKLRDAIMTAAYSKVFGEQKSQLKGKEGH